MDIHTKIKGKRQRQGNTERKVKTASSSTLSMPLTTVCTIFIWAITSTKQGKVQDKTRQDKTRHNKARQDKTRQDKTK